MRQKNDIIMMSLPKQWKQWGNADLRGTKQNIYRSKSFVESYSQLSLNGHLYKTDTSLRRTLGLVPTVFSIPYIETLYKTDTSIRRTTDRY